VIVGGTTTTVTWPVRLHTPSRPGVRRFRLRADAGLLVRLIRLVAAGLAEF
jgi:hypothetical protein